MNGQFDTSEMIDVVDVHYELVKVRCQKYTCRCGSCIETAPGPQRAVPGGRYSIDFAAHVAINKYLDHLPLNRQAEIMKRHDLVVSPSTLWDQLQGLHSYVVPSVKELMDHLLASDIIGLDQTSWPRLNKTEGPPWQMWALTTKDTIWFQIRNDKSKDTMIDILGDQPCIVVCDMLSTHLSVAHSKPQITLAGCWAHALRRFRAAVADFPQAEIALDLIRALYDIDKEADSLKNRAELRKKKSQDVLDKLLEWLQVQPLLKTTSFGQAVRYLLGHWNYFIRFVDDARIPLDNNATNAARGISCIMPCPRLCRVRMYSTSSSGY